MNLPLPDSPVNADPHAAQAADAMFDAVYARLKAMAGRQLASQAHDTLHTTALVHELYLRVTTNHELEFAHPAQFFAYAALAMRHLLRDRARNRLRQCAGGEWMRVSLSGDGEKVAIESAEQALAMDEALGRLEQIDARAARVVELRYFAGLSMEQTAETLGVARSTVNRDWFFARAFLHDLLAE